MCPHAIMPVLTVARTYNYVARTVSVMVIKWVIPAAVEMVTVVRAIPAVISSIISTIVPWVIETAVIPRVVPSSIPWIIEPRVKISVAAPIAISPSVPIRTISPRAPIWTIGP